MAEALDVTGFPKQLKRFKNSSVVFVFANGNIPPIACTLDFLYAKPQGKTEYITSSWYPKWLKDSNFAGKELHQEDLMEYKTGPRFRFYNTIQALKFEYGLLHEYYKNKYGIWVDMLALRNDARLNYRSDIIYRVFYDDELGRTYYELLADLKSHFDGNSVSMIDRQYIVDPRTIPAVDNYMVAEDPEKPHIGTVYPIGEGDGLIEYREFEKLSFEKASLHKYRYIEGEDKTILFSEFLADAETETVAKGSFEDNDNHKFDDLKLILTKADGTPYTDTDNLLIYVNGLSVDYVKSPTAGNVIYLQNVVRFASLQAVGFKKDVLVDAYKKEVVIGHENRTVIDYETTSDMIKYAYKFEVRIYKWKGVKISHFEKPIDTLNVLKSEDNSTNTFWLTTGLIFSHPIDPDKTILLNTNEIVPKSEWYVDPKNTNAIQLRHTDAEFNMWFLEMRYKLNEFLETMINRTRVKTPKLDEYLEGKFTKEEMDEAFELYKADMEQYMQYRRERSNLDIAYETTLPLSAIATVMNEFVHRTYRIIRLDRVDESFAYPLVYENHHDILLDKPYMNKFRNRNWDPEDIVVINGVKYEFESEYEDVFKVPTTKWQRTDNNVFEAADAFKLQICTKDILKA